MFYLEYLNDFLNHIVNEQIKLFLQTTSQSRVYNKSNFNQQKNTINLFYYNQLHSNYINKMQKQ